jgi:hypothetical protein
MRFDHTQQTVIVMQHPKGVSGQLRTECRQCAL